VSTAEYAPAGDPGCAAPLGGFAPAVGSRWVDKHHDVWTMRADGLMETPETRPFPPAHVEKKWGPLLPVTDVSAADRAMAEHVDAMDALQDVGAFDREAQDAAETRAYHEWLDRNGLAHSDEAYDQYAEYLAELS
jgi:hypothetical protein